MLCTKVSIFDLFFISCISLTNIIVYAWREYKFLFKIEKDLWLRSAVYIRGVSFVKKCSDNSVGSHLFYYLSNLSINVPAIILSYRPFQSILSTALHYF